MIFLCSPNNPSGNSLDRGSIYKILKNYEGIVVIDEAYIDFSAYPSFLKELSGFPNLIVLQTLSKAGERRVFVWVWHSPLRRLSVS